MTLPHLISEIHDTKNVVAYTDQIILHDIITLLQIISFKMLQRFTLETE